MVNATRPRVMSRPPIRGQGIYLFRTRKPHAPFGLPIIGRHNGYVGQSNDYARRYEQHIRGGGRYNVRAKHWSDLRPRFHRILPLPRWMFDLTPWAVNVIEALCIFVLLPVYNVKLNKHNLRRISLQRQRAHRFMRDSTPPGALRFVNSALTLLKWIAIIATSVLIYRVTQA